MLITYYYVLCCAMFILPTLINLYTIKCNLAIFFEYSKLNEK